MLKDSDSENKQDREVNLYPMSISKNIVTSKALRELGTIRNL